MKIRYPNVSVWVAFLSCMSTVACVRSLDVSKVRCTQSANCPPSYICSPSGTCVSGTSSDGSHDGAIDRAGATDGISPSSEASSGEAGPSDVPLVGSDGAATGGAGAGSGGAGTGGAGGGGVGSGGVGAGGVGVVGTGGAVWGLDAGLVATGDCPARMVVEAVACRLPAVRWPREGFRAAVAREVPARERRDCATAPASMRLQPAMVRARLANERAQAATLASASRHLHVAQPLNAPPPRHTLFPPA